VKVSLVLTGDFSVCAGVNRKQFNHEFKHLLCRGQKPAYSQPALSSLWKRSKKKDDPIKHWETSLNLSRSYLQKELLFMKA